MKKPDAVIDIARNRRDATRLIRARFWVALAMIGAVLLTYAVLTGAQYRHIRNSFVLGNALQMANSVQAMALERLASVRAFVITGDSTNLRRELMYREQIHPTMDSLRSRLDARMDTAALGKLDVAAEQVSRWESEFAAPMLALSRAKALELNAEQLAGSLQFEQVRAAIGELVGDIQADMRLSVGRVRQLLGIQFVALVLELLVLLFVLLRFRHLILNKAAALEEQQERLEEQAMELEQQQVELEASNEELSNTAADAEEARDQAEAALKELNVQTALLSSALDSSPLGFAFFGRDLRFIRVNAALTRMSGLSASHYAGKTLGDVHPGSAAEAEERLGEVLRTGEVSHGSGLFAAEATDGDEIVRHLLTSYFPIRSNSLEVLGVGVVVADMSDQKRLEDELRQSQKMEAVGQLAGGIAHDFNNLLTVIVGHSEMLLAQLKDEVAVDDAQQIQRAASQAAALTQKLLAFSRKQVLLPKVISLNNVVDEMAPMLRRLIREDIEIEVKVEEKLARVKADPMQIEQVILNLAVNARDAMPRGGRLGIRTENAELDDEYVRAHSIEAGPGYYAVLIVSDSGVGMDAAVRKRAFEPFFTTKETGKGTGLGLATVYGIVKQSGGHIWLYSEPGLGTTFKVYLPVFDGVATAPTYEAAAVPGAREAETILLVEDDPAVLGLARRVLEGLRYRVVTATNGNDALRLFVELRGEIHLTLTDVVMPEMGGAELAKRLWSHDPSLPVVYMSGYTGDDMLEHGIVDTDAVYVQKPFTTQALATAVRSALERGARR